MLVSEPQICTACTPDSVSVPMHVPICTRRHANAQYLSVAALRWRCVRVCLYMFSLSLDVSF